MWIENALLNGERPLIFIAGGVLSFLLVSFFIGLWTKSGGLFSALAWVGIGCGCMVAQSFDCSLKGARTLLFSSATVAGGFYFFLLASLRLGARRTARKRRREERRRKVEYTLPEKYNSFVRERLHTALQAKEEEEIFPVEEMGVRLGYAKRTAGKLKESPLTLVERAEVDEMWKLLVGFSGKSGWSRAEMREVNDIFSRLLKLSAKHEIPLTD